MDISATFRWPAIVAANGAEQTLEKHSSSAVDGATDEALLKEVCEGGRKALALLFRRYARMVRGIAYRVLRDPSEADDLLQDLFLYIYRKAGMFDSTKGSARSWIVQMTYHRAIDRRRYLNARHFYSRVDLNDASEILDVQSESGAATFAAELVGNMTMSGLLGTLTEDQRDTLSLHFYEGYTFEEIARKLGQSLGNIRHHYYRGLDRLRKQMFPARLPGGNGYGRK